MEEKIIKVVEKFSLPLDQKELWQILNLELLPEKDKSYFNLILKNLQQEGHKKLLLHPKINLNELLKSIILNIGLHINFHEFSSSINQQPSNELLNEFKLVTQLYLLSELTNLRNFFQNQSLNYENFLEKLAYGFLILTRLDSQTLTERGKIERAISYQLYYDSIIKKSWWGLEIDYPNFYQKLKELHFWPEKKILKLLNEGGYFVLENIQ